MPAVSYPKQWQETDLLPADSQAGLVFRAQRTKPPASLIVRRTPRNLSATFAINDLVEDMAKAFASRVKGAKQIHAQTAHFGSYQAVSVRYQQPDSKTKEIYENLVIVTPMRWQTLHFVFRAKAKGFAHIQSEAPKIVKAILKNFF